MCLRVKCFEGVAVNRCLKLSTKGMRTEIDGGGGLINASEVENAFVRYSGHAQHIYNHKSLIYVKYCRYAACNWCSGGERQ